MKLLYKYDIVTGVYLGQKEFLGVNIPDGYTTDKPIGIVSEGLTPRRENEAWVDVQAEVDKIFEKKKRSDILCELKKLDEIISRETEQQYDDFGMTPTYQPMADAITRKKELRQQLVDLS